MSSYPVADALPGLALLVLKDGLGVGRVGEFERSLLLGLVWAGLPRHTLTERDVNEALKAQLATSARCLDTDHVELRRWLCDSGWLHRDAYGRQYHRVAQDALPSAIKPLGAALDEAFRRCAVSTWVDSLRAEQAAARQARRLAFEGRSGATPPAAA